MQEQKTSSLNVILYANALILVLGTIFQNNESPYAGAVMSILFIAWCGLFVWHLFANKSTEVA